MQSQGSKTAHRKARYPAMITVEVFFSDDVIFRSVRVKLWRRGVRFTVDYTIEDGAYMYTITEYNCDASVIINAFDKYFNVTAW